MLLEFYFDWVFNFAKLKRRREKISNSKLSNKDKIYNRKIQRMRFKIKILPYYSVDYQCHYKLSMKSVLNELKADKNGMV